MEPRRRRRRRSGHYSHQEIDSIMHTSLSAETHFLSG